jgi:hypothetical protein
MVFEPRLRLRLRLSIEPEEPVAKFHLNTQLFNIYSLFMLKITFGHFEGGLLKDMI